MKNFGICKLTGHRGQFVKSHLLPKALTQPERPGNHFIQGGHSSKPTKRFSSWYDSMLVIRKGEEILRDYDTSGISELRRLKLIWSSWGGTDTYAGSDLTFFHTELMPGHGVRTIRDVDVKSLRLFFLSLLWRAAATELNEFNEIGLELSELEALRALVLNGLTGNLDFYPVTLTQIVTRGPTHNLTPFSLDTNHNVGSERLYRLSVFRFYFDGLIAYFHKPESSIAVPELGAFIVGHGPTLVVQCIPAEGSFELRNLLQGISEAHLQWPRTMARYEPQNPISYESRLALYESIAGPNHPWLVRRE